jgi:hypothetical protein
MRILIAFMMCLGISLAGIASPGDAWPWGAEMPFPWKGIQGTWSVFINDQPVLFSFKTIQSGDGTNQLSVHQYDGRTCELLAFGNGFEEKEQERVVRGMILTPNGAKNFTIHRFSEAALKMAKEGDSETKRRQKTYTVMNITDFFDIEDAQVVELRKVHSSSTGICTTKQFPQ